MFRVSNFAFILYVALFPLYIIYSYLVIKGSPDLFGGMFSLFCLIFFPISIFYFLTSLSSRNSISDLMLGVFVLYIFIFTTVFVLTNGASVTEVPVIHAFFSIIITISGWFMARYIDLRIDLTRYINNLLIISIAFLYIYVIFSEGSIFGMLLIFLDESGVASTYQGIGRSLFFMAVFTLFFYKNISPIYIIIFFLILLLLTGSRTSLISFVMLALTYYFIGNIRIFLYLSLFLFIFFFITAGILNNYFPETYDEIAGSRLFELFNLSGSASFSLRINTFYDGWQIIKGTPLLGEFGHYFYAGGGYPHNILYAWSNWGIIGFLLSLSLLISAIIKSLTYLISNNQRNSRIVFSFAVSTCFTFFFLDAPIENISLGILIGMISRKDYEQA